MNELRHYGVKGMKWGVRKDRDTPTMPTKGRVSSGISDSKNVKIMNNKGEVTSIRRKDLPRILVENRKHVGVGGVNKQLYTELYNELSEEQLSEVEDLEKLEEVFDELEEELEDEKDGLLKELKDSLSKEEKSELKNLKKELKNEYKNLSPEEKEVVDKIKDKIPSFLKDHGNLLKRGAQEAISVKHRVNTFLKGVKTIPHALSKPKHSTAKEKRTAETKKGLTSKTTITTVGGKSVSRTSIKKKKSKSFLKHYGVKGMKWGVRKARPTSGKKRGKTNAQRIYEHVTRKKETPKATTKTSSKPAKHRISDMSDDELRSAINRMQMERTYAQLTSKEVSKGRKFVNDVMYNSAKSVATKATTAAMESALKKLTNRSSSGGGS